MSWMQTMYKYQFDKTGRLPTNLISFEEVIFATNSIVPFPVKEGMFYTDSVVITDTATQRTLSTEEYKFIAIDPFITARTGKETAGAIELVNNNYIGTLSVSYQCVGGAEGMSNSLILKLIEAIEGAQEGGDWTWEMIQGKPSLFPPENHTHFLSGISELGTLKQALEDVANALIHRTPIGESGAEYQEQINRVIKIQASMQNSINKIALEHGTAEDLEDLENLIKNDHRNTDGVASLVAGDYQKITDWNIVDGISAKGSIMFTDGTDVESVNFSIVWTEEKDPKISSYGNTRTGDKLIDLMAIKVASKIELRVKPSVGGNAYMKWSELF